MDTKVSAFAATPDATFGQSQPAPQPVTDGAAQEAQPNASNLDLRLVIEEDLGSGSYVYKTVNRRTGEVLQSLPRADILRLREEAAYAAGSVIRTEA